MLAIHHSVLSSLLRFPPDLEIVSIQVSFKPPVTICLVYVPPSSDQQHYSDMLYYLESLAVTYPNLVILGDFNSPDICWPISYFN